MLEPYLVKGDCVCTAVTGLWFMNCVLWLFLFAVTVALAGVQLSGTSEKRIGVTRLNLLQDLLEASRGLCGEMSHTSIDRFKARTHRDEYRRTLFVSVFQRVFCVHTQAIFADDEPSEHANSFPDIRWRLM